MELLYEIGELHEQKLREASSAVDQYEAVLEKNPTHVRAQQALERLLSDAGQRQRIATLLEPFYDAQGAWSELANVLEVQLEDVSDPGGRVGLLSRLANLYEDRLHDSDKAFASLSQAVLADPADGGVREELARVARIRGADRERAEVLEKAVESAADSGYLQAEILLELARLWDEQVGDVEAAERAFTRLIEVDGDNPDSVLPAARALERIHLAGGAYEKLAEDLRRQIRLEHDQEARAELLVRLATLLEETLEDVEGAIAAHRQRLDIDPADVDALRSLERLYGRTGEWQRLIGVLQARDAATMEESEQAEIARRIGEIYETKLDDADNAIVAYNDALSRFGPSEATLDALARLYGVSEKWDDLLEILELQVEQTTDPERLASLRFQSAELMRRTGDFERAIETYGEVLSLVPGHEGTVNALEEVITDPDAGFRVEAARTLVPHYESTLQHGNLIAALEVVAETDEPIDKLQALRRAAEIAEIGMEDQGMAFSLMSKAVRAGLHEPDLSSMIHDLERHAVAAEKHTELAQLLEDLAPDIMDGDLQTEALMKAATTVRGRLGDGARARSLFGRILHNQPDHRPALDALEELHGEAEDFEALLEVVQRKAEIAETPAERITLLERQATICEEQTGDLTAAIDAYEQVLGESESHLDAYVALHRLYTKAERWNDLSATLERQLDAGVGSAVDVRFELGKVNLERLNDPYQAIEHLREALAQDGNHEPSVGLLERVMEHEEHRSTAAEILEPVFLRRMDWPKVTATLEARLASSDDIEERKRILQKLGQIHEDYLEDLEGALGTYARLFREDPRDRDVWATLSRLANVLEQWGELGGIYADVTTENGIMDEETAEIARMAGRIFDERVGDAARSAELYALVLEFEPTDVEAFGSLESAYHRLDRTDDLLQLYRRRVDVAESDDERVSLLHKLARSQEEKKGDGEGAIETYREVLQVAPDDATAIDALDRLLTTHERWVDLVDHVRFQIDGAVGTDGEADLKHRLASLLAERLEDKVGALDVLEEVVQDQPGHTPSVRALEALGGDPELRLRVTQILEPLYRGADDWQKLVGVLEAQVALAEDPPEQARLLAEIGRLHEERGGDGARAFHAWARAFAADPHDESARGELDRLAGLLGAWDEHVAAYEQALATTHDPMLISQLLSTMARVHDEKRGDPRAAIQTYERVLENDPDDASTLDALEALHTMVGDWRGLVDVLDRKVERSYEPAERAELLRRAGSVLEELLGDPAGAIELYTRASQEDDTDVIALEALDRLYTSANNFEALADVLRQRVELEEPADRAALGLRLGQLLETQLGAPDQAIDAFVAVLEAEPSQPDAVASLSRLYERQGLWPELLDNLKLQAGMAQSADERVQLIFRAGEVTERELDDVLEALTLYQQALEMDTRHEPSMQALIRISHLEDYRLQAAEILEPLLTVQERWDRLADLLALKADAATDPYDKKQELMALARVRETGLQDASGAFDATALALAEDAADEEIAEELERLAAATDGYRRLADELAARASHSFDPVVARGHFVRLARVAEERLGDDARAVDAFQRALEQTGDDEDLLAALDRLHVKTEAHSALAEVLERRINLATDPVERADFLVRLGTLREQQFGDLRGAFAAFQEIVERDPADDRALDGLQRLGQHEELALEVVDTLEAAFRETGALDRIAGLYDIRIQLADSDGERVRMLQDAAALWENELGQPDKALESLCKAFQIDPRDSVLLEDIERLAATSGNWEALRGMVEGAVAGDIDRDLQRDLNLRAAAWYRDHLGDVAAAEQRLRAALEADPELNETHEQLVDLLRVPEREGDLVAALQAWAAVEIDEYAKKDRLREAARLAESALGDFATAASCYEMVLETDPADVETLDDLIRLRTNEGRWIDVVPLLERRIDAEMDPGARLDLRRQLAEVYAGPIDDKERATAAFEAILDEAPEDLDAIGALEGLYDQAERWDDLRGLLDRRLDIAVTDDDRVAARVRLARLSERAFGRRDDAMNQLREILEIDQTNVEALGELERLLTLEEHWDDLAELLDRRSGDAAAIGDVETQKVFLVRLAALHEEKRESRGEALAVLDRVLTLDPNNLDALRKRVVLFESAEDWAQAVEALEQLLPHLEVAEAVATCHRIADLSEEKLEDPARSAGALRAAFDLQPSATTRELLKAHYEKHENWRELAELLEGEVEDEPDPTSKVAALKRIAGIYTEQLDEAAAGVVFLERAAELTPDDREVLLPLCDIYIAAGRQQDAVPVLEKIISSFGTRRSKELAKYHHRLGRALEGMGDIEGALSHYDSAFKIDLTNVQILRDLGRLCHAREDWPRAQKTFRALLLQKLGPDAGITKADVYYFLGDISSKTGDTRKAISMLERAVAEQKDHAEAAALLAQLKS
ncbi:MAG: tetratricopeptide repeat protein [Myxococcota bacterium]